MIGLLAALQTEPPVITIPMTELPQTGVLIDPATGLAIGMLIACLGLATMAARDGIRARRAARRDVTE
jgi:hypothetical protein